MNRDGSRDELTKALEQLARALHAYLGPRPALRQTVHHLAKVVLELSEPGSGGDGAHSGGGAEAQQDAAPEVKIVQPLVPQVTGVVKLKLGDTAADVPVSGTSDEIAAARRAGEVLQVENGRGASGGGASAGGVRVESLLQMLPDLDLVRRRTGLKAEVCRYVMHKRRRLGEGADFFSELQPREYELRDRLKMLPNCYIPILRSDARLPDDEAIELLAHAYENLSAAAGLVSGHDPASARQAPLHRVCELLAWGQSALRSALEEAWVPGIDTDQKESFEWLTRVTKERRLYLSQHMRSDTAADPRKWEELAREIVLVQEEAQRARERQMLLRKIAYESAQIREERGEPAHHWRTLLGAVEMLLEQGMPASDPDLRELLVPVVEDLPPEIEPGAQARIALREAQAYVEQMLALDSEEDEEAASSPEVVQQAARLLEGKHALLIGGEDRPEAARALEEQLRLAEVRWRTKRPHASTQPFETEIARAETDVVFVLTKLSNKHDGPEILAMCRKHDKPCVMLPAGYNPAQVAHQFLRQASGRFSAAS
jgi:hypothetical protein